MFLVVSSSFPHSEIRKRGGKRVLVVVNFVARPSPFFVLRLCKPKRENNNNRDENVCSKMASESKQSQIIKV